MPDNGFDQQLAGIGKCAFFMCDNAQLALQAELTDI